MRRYYRTKTLQQQKDDFIAIASHELKTPVTSIKAYTRVVYPLMNKRIAVIEDNRDILDLIECILTDEGYDIQLYDRIAPIDQIIAEQPAVILLDNRLGNGFGANLCLSLKSNQKRSKYRSS